ncbi:cytidine deaminase [Nesidiocoris tenuis]|uniref:Cytidine deaminase n=1 Tax=Nesidiocoris tenuis TaxID=355587 RepID=A0ABN7AD45_9HEMI|nr:cytidine deaminase [Nesidiocoris tenuis]
MSGGDSIGRVVDLSSLDKRKIDLIKKAAEAREFAYSPYSNFKVGCALVTKKGDVYTGCNVENASYGVGICAERTAIVKAVSSGDRDIVEIAVVAEMTNQITAPCGACRQFINEFSVNNDILIYCADAAMKKVLNTTNSQLLPWGFRL